jgi:hypothetical protein
MSQCPLRTTIIEKRKSKIQKEKEIMSFEVSRNNLNPNSFTVVAI